MGPREVLELGGYIPLEGIHQNVRGSGCYEMNTTYCETSILPVGKNSNIVQKQWDILWYKI